MCNISKKKSWWLKILSFFYLVILSRLKLYFRGYFINAIWSLLKVFVKLNLWVFIDITLNRNLESIINTIFYRTYNSCILVNFLLYNHVDIKVLKSAPICNVSPFSSWLIDVRWSSWSSLCQDQSEHCRSAGCCFHGDAACWVRHDSILWVSL